MKPYLKHYKLRLTTLAPVFIGSGETINKSEYVFDGQYVYVADPKKLMNMIVNKKLIKSFTNSMTMNSFNLKFWLDKNIRINYDDISMYKLSGIENIDDKHSLKGINACVKNAYGKPYIPGSSLKGAIRTVIMWDKINDSYKNLDKFHNSAKKILNEDNKNYLKKQLNKLAEELERDFFNERKNTETPSIMKGLMVGDSKPLSLDDIVLCEKIDVNVRKDKPQKKPNILRECIRPGTVIEFDITVDNKILGFDADCLMEMIDNYSKAYHKIITEKFPYGEDIENTIFLGGGAGYFSKTVSYGIFNEYDAIGFVRSYLSKTTDLKHNHKNDRSISPHMQKCTRCDGKIYEMGKCRIEIEETGGNQNGKSG